MQDYKFSEAVKMSAINMRWCIGYLSPEEQLAWLRKAKAALDNEKKRYTRSKPPPSYIFVLDNVDESNRKDILRIHGQTVRKAEYYQKLWPKAGLEVQDSERKCLNGEYIAVMMWALY